MMHLQDDSLLRDMIADEQKYSSKPRTRRAKGIARLEPPDVLAFYDQQIAETDQRINRLLGRPANEENR